MLKHPDLTERRVDLFIRLTLTPLLYPLSEPLTLEFGGEGCETQREARASKLKPVSSGFEWGPAWGTVWFKASGKIPKSWDGGALVARLEVGGERTVWHENTPAFGIDEFHKHYRLPKHVKPGDNVEIWVQAYGANPPVKVHGVAPDLPEKPFKVESASLDFFDVELWQLYVDCKFYLDLVRSLPDGDPARMHLLTGLNEAINMFDETRRETLAEARKIIRQWADSKRTDDYHVMTPVGHAHLDSAWLWPVSMTKKKMAHTTASQLALMDEYPEHVFVHSQASQYEWLETQHPRLFEAVRARIKKGQWEPVGSMWVEADTNLAGGEALVRQFLYGKRYFKEKFGIETKDMWLPDVFGYSAATPQILAKCNIDYFLTQKISWNQINKFPHNTFWWQGIDGTRVWTHFPPSDTYTGLCGAKDLRSHVTVHRDAARSDRGLYVFGYGDGGGGPTAEHLEVLRRAANAPGVPRIVRQKAVDFFEDAAEASRDLPVWVGELYAEFHRGTYTTQAATKKGNRECEMLLRDAEFLCAAAYGGGREYPAKELESLWKVVLFNQFHDILPGSSVHEVYVDAEREYDEVRAALGPIIENAIKRMVDKSDTSTYQKPIALFQFSDLAGQGAIEKPKGRTPKSIMCGSESMPVQEIDDFGSKKLVFPLPETALNGVAICDLSDEPPQRTNRLIAKPRRIENDTWSVRFDSNGNITSILSLEDRTEFIEKGKLANLFQIFDDRPLFWSAWDIDAFALETAKDLVKSERFEIVEEGPVRVAVEIEKRIGESVLKQRISLGPTPGIRFDTWVDWRETEKMLKVAFPVAVSSPRATFEIQFGNVERPTHRNTSWDIARFEVCAHKWIDLSEGDHGVALINDCKYGHDVLGNVMRLTLLRSPKAPDKTADMGIHRFSYVLMPHFGPYNWANVVPAAYALNAPVHSLPLEKHSPNKPEELEQFIASNDRNIVIESVKKAEDSNALIVRAYEAHNARGGAEIFCAKTLKRVTLCDMLENEVEDVPVADGAFRFAYKPFEILTFKLELS